MASPLEEGKSVSRLLTEKMGARSVGEFKGNAGEVFYDPAKPELYLSYGPDEEPVPLITAALGDFVIEAADYVVPRNISTLSSLPTSRYNRP